MGTALIKQGPQVVGQPRRQEYPAFFLTLPRMGPPFSSHILALFLLSFALYHSRPTKFAPMGQLPSTSRDLCYLGLKSNGRLLKSVGRKLRCSCDILLALFVVVSAIGIPIGSFSMHLLFACSEMPMFPREVKRGDLLKRRLPLRAICHM